MYRFGEKEFERTGKERKGKEKKGKETALPFPRVFELMSNHHSIECSSQIHTMRIESMYPLTDIRSGRFL
jgi:hypothetical protein